MPIKAITVTDTYVELAEGDRILHFDFADFPASAGTNAARQQHVIDHVQSWLDHVVKLRDLPDDDPDKITDPGLPYLFHRGTGGNAELVVRTVEIQDVSYDSALTPPLRFRIVRVWP